jgi:hypothetical protein
MRRQATLPSHMDPGRYHDRHPGVPLRQVLFADLRTVAPDSLACGLSVPLKPLLAGQPAA